MEIKEGVLEEFPEWDKKENKVKWTKEIIHADPTFIHLFQVLIHIFH